MPLVCSDEQRDDSGLIIRAEISSKAMCSVWNIVVGIFVVILKSCDLHAGFSLGFNRAVCTALFTKVPPG